jgi:hypothetical protein
MITLLSMSAGFVTQRNAAAAVLTDPSATVRATSEPARPIAPAGGSRPRLSRGTLQENDALIQLGQHLHHDLPDISSRQ